MQWKKSDELWRIEGIPSLSIVHLFTSYISGHPNLFQASTVLPPATATSHADQLRQFLSDFRVCRKKHKIFHQLWTNRCSQKKNGEGGQGIPCRLHPKSIANSHNFLLESFSILRVPSFGGWKSHVKYCISPFFEGFQHHHPGTCSAFNLTRLRFLSTTIATDDLLVGLPPSRELEFKNPPKKLLSTRNYRM